jgi:hypothetical protein
MNIVKYMIKKIKNCTKKEIFNAIFNDGQTSVGDDNCRFCKYQNQQCHCKCDSEYANCIDYQQIITEVGEEEVEVEDE